MHDYEATSPAPPSPERGAPSEKPPEGDPMREQPREPWHDPGPPTKKVNLPPDSPSPGIIIPPPANPMIS
jgi:hypothetical protein